MPTSITTPYTGFTSSDQPATVTTTYPTVPSSVPTSAPPVTTPVVSSSTAGNYINNTIVPTMTSAQTNLNNYLTSRNATTISKKTGADGISEMFLSDGSRVKTDAQGNVLPAEKTLEQQIVDIPTTGYKFVYNPKDGTRTEIPINESAAMYGMSDNNPTIAPIKPVLFSAELPSGTSIKQYNDGTYGMFDVSGKYIGNATATQFQNAKNGQDVLDKLNQAVNGEYPLSANQQSQIDSVKNLYNNLIKEQEKANANLTGGTTVAQNLYGIGNTMMGMGQIKGVIDSGISKITDIQSRMNSDVAKMTQAFQENNLQALKDAYNAFSANQKQLQDNLDKIHSEATTIARDEAQQRAQAELAIDNDIRGLIETATANGASTQQLQSMQDALINHDYTSAAKAGGDALMTASGVVGEYYAYARDAKSRGVVPMTMDDYFTKDANRKARIAAAGASVVAGTDMTARQQSVFNALVDARNKSPLIAALDRAVTLRSAIDNARKDPSKGYIQRNLAYSYVQALDTYQSAVREGELKDVASVDSLVGKFDNMIQKIDNGQFGRPEAILEMANAADLLYKTIEKAALQKKNAFKAQATVNGVDKQFDYMDNLTTQLNSQSAQDVNSAVESKTIVDEYVNNNPTEAGMIADMYEIEGTTDDDIAEFLRGAGKI